MKIDAEHLLIQHTPVVEALLRRLLATAGTFTPKSSRPATADEITERVARGSGGGDGGPAWGVSVAGMTTNPERQPA